MTKLLNSNNVPIYMLVAREKSQKMQNSTLANIPIYLVQIQENFSTKCNLFTGNIESSVSIL